MLIDIENVGGPMAPDGLAAAERRVLARLTDLDRVAVAYSGGVDSALMLALAAEALGDRATALTAVSPSLAQAELAAAAELAAGLGVRHELVSTTEVSDPRYAANSEARCYFCKEVVYTALQDHATRMRLGALVDGMNRDDTLEHRPGRGAAELLGVLSPLYEAGIGKAGVRTLAKARGLSVWSKPAMACLASRVPHGSAVTPAKLAQIEAAEALVGALGCRQVRVRHYGDSARIEVAQADLALVLSRRDEVVAGLRALGFVHVSLDLAGYRSGNLSPGGG